MLHLRIFQDEFVRPAFAALFLAVDGLDDFFHLLFAEEFPRFGDGAEEGQAARALGVLGQHDHVVEQVDHAVGGMGDYDDDLALIGNHAKLLKQLPGHHAVQAAVRLVQDEQGGVGNELHGDGQALALAAGELGHQTVLYRGEAENLHHFFHPGIAVGSGKILWQAQGGRVDQGAVHAVGAAHQIQLRHEADIVLHFLVVLVHIGAVEHHLRLGLFVAVHGVQIGCFARAGAAQQQHHMAGLDIHVDIPQQICFFEKFGGGAFFQVHRQALIQHLGLGAGEEIGRFALDVLHGPQGLELLIKAPQGRHDVFQQCPQNDPLFFPVEHLDQAQLHAHHIDKLDHQQDERHGAEEQIEGAFRIQEQNDGVAHVHQYVHDSQHAALRFAPGAQAQLVFPGEGNQRPPPLHAALVENAPKANDGQAVPQNRDSVQICVEQQSAQDIQNLHCIHPFIGVSCGGLYSPSRRKRSCKFSPVHWRNRVSSCSQAASQACSRHWGSSRYAWRQAACCSSSICW